MTPDEKLARIRELVDSPYWAYEIQDERSAFFSEHAYVVYAHELLEILDG